MEPYWSVFHLPFFFPSSHLYSKPCHLKNFGTRNLRHANLPNAPLPTDNRPSSPLPSLFSPQPLLRPLSTGGTPLPRLKPNRSLATSPISPTFRGSSPTSTAFQVPLSTGSEMNSSTTPINVNTIPEVDETEVQDILMASNDQQDEVRDYFLESSASVQSPYPSNTGRPGIGTIPRTIPLYLNNRTGYKHHTSHSVGSVPSNYSQREEAEGDLLTMTLTGPSMALDRNIGTYANFTPLKQTSTGTRYGVALTGGVDIHMTASATPSPRKWGAVTPVCPRCTKNVYFAEQVSFPIFQTKQKKKKKS